MFDWFRRKSTLRLCYVIMSKDSRFWLQDSCWGGADGRDMCDSQICARKRSENWRSSTSREPFSRLASTTAGPSCWWTPIATGSTRTTRRLGRHEGAKRM